MQPQPQPTASTSKRKLSSSPIEPNRSLQRHDRRKSGSNEDRFCIQLMAAVNDPLMPEIYWASQNDSCIVIPDEKKFLNKFLAVKAGGGIGLEGREANDTDVTSFNKQMNMYSFSRRLVPKFIKQLYSKPPYSLPRQGAKIWRHPSLSKLSTEADIQGLERMRDGMSKPRVRETKKRIAERVERDSELDEIEDDSDEEAELELEVMPKKKIRIAPATVATSPPHPSIPKLSLTEVEHALETSEGEERKPHIYRPSSLVFGSDRPIKEEEDDVDVEGSPPRFNFNLSPTSTQTPTPSPPLSAHPTTPVIRHQNPQNLLRSTAASSSSPLLAFPPPAPPIASPSNTRLPPSSTPPVASTSNAAQALPPIPNFFPASRPFLFSLRPPSPASTRSSGPWKSTVNLQTASTTLAKPPHTIISESNSKVNEGGSEVNGKAVESEAEVIMKGWERAKKDSWVEGLGWKKRGDDTDRTLREWGSYGPVSQEEGKSFEQEQEKVDLASLASSPMEEPQSDTDVSLNEEDDDYAWGRCLKGSGLFDERGNEPFGLF